MCVKEVKFRIRNTTYIVNTHTCPSCFELKGGRWLAVDKCCGEQKTLEKEKKPVK